MQTADDSAVEVSAKPVRTIPGKLDTNAHTCCQTVISDLQPLNARRRRQIETEPEFNDCTDDERIVDPTTLARDCFLRKIEAAPRIRLPEVNTGTKPIVVVIARTKRFSEEYSLADLTVAAVISKDECRSEPVQKLLIILGETTGFCVNALRDKGLNRGGSRLSCLSREDLGCLPETAKRLRAAHIVYLPGTDLFIDRSLHFPSVYEVSTFQFRYRSSARFCYLCLGTVTLFSLPANFFPPNRSPHVKLGGKR